MTNQARPKSPTELKASPKNPRRITKKRLVMLEKALDRFGDLGGVIYNIRTQGLVGGHQRVEAIRAATKGGQCTIERTREMDPPTAKGTVAEGYIAFNGERYSYREVDWDEDTERLANLAANKSAGYFDTSALAETLQSLDKVCDDLSFSMFDDDELAGYIPLAEDFSSAEKVEPEAPQADAVAEVRQPDQKEAPVTEKQVPSRPGDAPHAEHLEQPNIKQISLYFREADHAKFVELVDALKDVFHKSNVSDVVLEAVQRISISAAFK